MKKKLVKNKELVIYQAKSGAIELRGDFSSETIWATQAQIAEVFNIERSVITKHISNILKIKEVDEKSNVQKMHIPNSDKPVTFYSLDIILAVGYRSNSARAIEFRRWASKILREHIVKGYTINRKVILKNYENFLKTVSDIQALLPTHTVLDPKAILDLVKEYSTTWTKLDAYDKDNLFAQGVTKKKIKITGREVMDAILELKLELIKKKEATEIFAQDRGTSSVEGIIGNVMQSFGGADVYPTLEEKAAHLLYFMVKNHPFIDGNKRSGAFTFIWFLRKSGIKGARNINPSGLTAITLLIAESDPTHKDKMIALVVELLRVGK